MMGCSKLMVRYCPTAVLLSIIFFTLLYFLCGLTSLDSFATDDDKLSDTFVFVTHDNAAVKTSESDMVSVKDRADLFSRLLPRLQDEKVTMAREAAAFHLTTSMQKQASVNQGSVENLKSIITEVILSNRTLKIGALGGSITNGFLMQQRDIYANVFGKRLQQLLNVPVMVYRGAENSMGSYYFQYCSQEYLDLEDMDLILGDFAVNDGYGEISGIPQEKLLRHFLCLPKQPQVIYVNFLTGRHLHDGDCWNDEYQEITPLSRHYSVPSISFQSAVCPSQRDHVKHFFLKDGLHPNKLAHQIVSLLLLHFTVDVLLSLCNEVMNNPRVTLDMQKSIDNSCDLDLPPALWLKSSERLIYSKCWIKNVPFKTVSGTEANRLSPTKQDPGWLAFNRGFKTAIQKASIEFHLSAVWNDKSTCNVSLCVVPFDSGGTGLVTVIQHSNEMMMNIDSKELPNAPATCCWVFVAMVTSGDFMLTITALQNKDLEFRAVALHC